VANEQREEEEEEESSVSSAESEDDDERRAAEGGETSDDDDDDDDDEDEELSEEEEGGDDSLRVPAHLFFILPISPRSSDLAHTRRTPHMHTYIRYQSRFSWCQARQVRRALTQQRALVSLTTNLMMVVMTR
jgi:TATA-binding protein-associated factor Taf7